MHIGLTGTNASGKSTVIDILRKKGYVPFSLSDILRQELTQRNLEVSRENLIVIGNELREKYGAGVLAQRCIEQTDSDYLVIDSIRNPQEVTELRQLKNFFLIAVDAPPEIRFERAQARNRQENAATLEEFLAIENREKSQDKNAQNIVACMEMADFKLSNDGPIAELTQKIEAMLDEAQTRYRPSWDEYFMKMAFLVAERSTCLRHHVGAILVKQKQVLSTGYNGAARKTRDCTELGCLREELNIPSGTRQEICRAIHAEQNAIIQAARHGVNVNAATLYCTHSPCIICAKMIVNAGIKRIVVNWKYPDIMNLARDLYQESGVKIERIPMPNLSIRILK